MPWKPQTLKKKTTPPIELRGTACKRGYDRKWRKARDAYIDDNPFCEMCLANERHEQAVLVAHITPLSLKGARLNEDNFQSLCSSCHAKKTADDIKKDAGIPHN